MTTEQFSSEALSQRLLETPAKTSKKKGKKRKQREEFTVEEKVRILREGDQKHTTNPILSQKYGISVRCISRWRGAREQLESQITENKNKGNLKRIYDDPLDRIKDAVNNFYVLNEQQPPETRVRITGSVISSKAKMAKDLLIRQHATEPFLTEKEVKALTEFKASHSWARKTARRYGWKSAADDESPTMPNVAVAAAAAAAAATAAIASESDDDDDDDDDIPLAIPTDERVGQITQQLLALGSELFSYDECFHGVAAQAENLALAVRSAQRMAETKKNQKLKLSSSSRPKKKKKKKKKQQRGFI